MITEKQYIEAAKLLQVEVNAIKAVAEVESDGSGFFQDGKLKILFEPHIFWRELLATGIRPESRLKGNSDVLYKKWGAKPYGLYSQQWPKLLKAAKIHTTAAYKSASWGKFQPLGTYHQECGFKSIFDMVQAFEKGEGEHLKAFCLQVKARGLDKPLRNLDFAAFALGWNGSGYASAPGRLNDYDFKMNQLYLKLKSVS